MKKYVAIIVMICLSMSLLMGCGGSGGGGQNADAQPKEEAQAETAQAEAQQQEEAQAETVQVEAKQQENTQAEKTEAASQAGMQSFMALTSQADGYVVFVKDANTDEPLARVKVQFCSDSQCMMALTDNTGAAVFNVAPGNYEAHILKPPAGYQKSSETANLTADDKVAVLKLLKEGEELKTTEAADGTDAAAKETAEEGAKEKSNEFRKTDAEWSFDVTGFTFKAPERFKKSQKYIVKKGVYYGN